MVTCELVGDFKPGSPEWVAARERRIGGSEAAVCLGISPFESRFSLWHRKSGQVGPIEQTPILEWGNRLEAAVLQRWIDDHPEFDPIVAPAGSWVSTTHPFMTANPDALAFQQDGAHKELVEVKTSPYGDAWGDSGSDNYPVYYRAQVLHYMHVLGVERAHLIVLISGYDYREYVIEMDADARADVELIIEAEREFIDSLPGGPAEQRPGIDEHDATYQTLRELHPEIDRGEEVELPADIAEQYLSAGIAVKEAEAAKRKAASLVLDQMGEAQYATYNDQRIAGRQVRGDGNPFLKAIPASKKKAA